MNDDGIEEKVIDAFAGVASSVGYSDLHGRILGYLFLSEKPVPLQEIARKLNYSLSTISLSIDFLEALGTIKKSKKGADRKVYVLLQSDLLDCLRKAVLLKAEKAIDVSLNDLMQESAKIKGSKTEKAKKTLHTIKTLETEIKRLQSFLSLVKEFKLPKAKN